MVNKVIIEQSGTEEVTASDIKNISKLVDTLGEDSSLKGNLHTDLARAEYVDNIVENHPNVNISADDQLILESEYSDNEASIMAVISTNSLSADSSFMTLKEALNIDYFQYTWFQSNTNITDLSCLKYFTGIKYHRNPNNGRKLEGKGLNQSSFSGMTNLEKVILPPDLDLLGANGAMWCNNYGTFYGCSKLKYVDLNGCKALTAFDFYGCPIEKIDLSSVTKIYYETSRSQYVFYNAKFTAIDISSMVSTRALCGSCSNLESVTFGNTLTKLDGYNFNNCPNLVITELPASIKSIGADEFTGDTKITDVYLAMSSAPSLGNVNSFPSSTNFTCPETALDSYAGTTNWKTIWAAGRILGKTSGSMYVDINTITANASAGIVGFAYKCPITFNAACNPEQKEYSVSLSTDDVEFDGSAIILKEGKTFAEGTITVTSTSNTSVSSTASFSVADDGTNRTPIIDATRTDSVEMKANDEAIMSGVYTQGLSSSSKKFFEAEANAATLGLVDTVYGNDNIIDATFVKYFTNAYKNENFFVGNAQYPTKWACRNGMFTNCKNLKTIEFPEGLINLKGFVCSNCVSLVNVVIPSTLLTINKFQSQQYDGGAFYGCSSLVSIDVKNVTQLGYKGTINENSAGTFGNCTNLVSVTMPKVQIIGELCFKACTSLSKLELPDSVEYIGQEAFEDCSKLVISSLPSSLKEIKNGAFWGCTSMVNLSIPDLCSTIGQYAFYGCTSLESVQLPNNLETIKNNIFKNCSKLSNITFPESIKTIEENAFCNCTSLTSIDLNNVETIADCSAYCSPFMGCTNITSFSWGNKIKKIGNHAFSNQDNRNSWKMECVTSLPDTLEYIGSFCFRQQKLSLTSLPESMVTICEQAFFSCPNVDIKVIPANVTYIGRLAFRGSANDSYIKLLCTSVPTLQAGSGSNDSFVNDNVVIYVLDELLDAYSTATNWSAFYSAGKIKPISEFTEE